MDTAPSSAKEKQEIPGGLEAPTLTEVGKEAPLPAEVSAAGVQVHPASVPLPQPIQQLGVKQVGTIQTQTAPVILPLTDEQIAKGLHASITSSLRWLAEWCMRRIKYIQKVIKK